jgi:hypothetical protein
LMNAQFALRITEPVDGEQFNHLGPLDTPDRARPSRKTRPTQVPARADSLTNSPQTAEADTLITKKESLRTRPPELP